jgi:hypothetical protein
VLGGGSIAIVQASIIGDFDIGYQDGKNHGYNDFYAGINDDSFPSGVGTSYCSEYVVGYDDEQGTVKQAQLGEV